MANIEKWEYITWHFYGRGINNFKKSEIERQLNELGAEGWELISPEFLTSLPATDDKINQHLLFKRKST